MKYLTFIFFLSLFLFLTSYLFAQNNKTTIQNDSLCNNKLNVYFNCPYCDMNFVKNEITFINYVRDQKDAQLYVLVSQMNTGSGGGEYTIYFIGQKEFAGKSDTLKFNTYPDDTEEVIRKGYTNILKMGFMRFVSQTPLAQDISITYTNQDTSNSITAIDPWNNWVVDLYSYFYIKGEESMKYFYNYSSVDAYRVTEKERFNISAYSDFTQSKFKLNEPDTTIISRSNSKKISALYVGSINDHWSFGGETGVFSNSYNNIYYAANIQPTIEYNFFKYSESTRRQLRFKYLISFDYNSYIDTTIYNEKKQMLYSHYLGIAYKVIEKWGSVSATLSGSNYLHDMSKYRCSFYTNLSIRLFKGLSVTVNGQINSIHDQLYLPKQGATPEEILTQQKQLATQYSFYTNVGLIYTFGSMYNNVVNPRFGY